MKDAHSISTRPYGVQRVAACGAAPALACMRGGRRQRPGRRVGSVGRSAPPRTTCWPATCRLLEASPFHGEGHRKAWAKLRVAGIRTSPERVRRLMREHDLQAPHRVGHAHGPKAHDGTITTAGCDVGGHDGHSDRGRGRGLRRGRRSLLDRVHRPVPSAGPDFWSRSARASAPAHDWRVARGLRLRHAGRTIWLTINRRWRGIESSPVSCGSATRRTLHPHAEGEFVVGAEFRHHRGAPPGLTRVQADVQRAVDVEKYHYQSPDRDFVGLDAAA